MRGKRGTVTREGGRPEAPSQGSAGDDGEEPDAIQVGRRIDYPCHWCGSGADATYKEWPPGSGLVEWQIGCHKPHRSDPGYLPALAELLGLGRYADKRRIAAALGDLGRTARPPTGPPPALPTAQLVARWQARLRHDSVARRYLTQRRHISRRVLRAARVGFDGTHLTFPMHDGRSIVALKRREPRSGATMLKPRGSGAWAWPLYPEPEPDDEGRTFLVEGELDALRLRSVSVPATSVTGGVGHWKDEWIDQLRGLRVVVAFDVGFDGYAERRADTLRAAGIRARAFDLRRLGLTKPNEDVSDYLDRGGSPGRLRRALNRPRVRTTKGAAT